MLLTWVLQAWHCRTVRSVPVPRWRPPSGSGWSSWTPISRCGNWLLWTGTLWRDSGRTAHGLQWPKGTKIFDCRIGVVRRIIGIGYKLVTRYVWIMEKNLAFCASPPISRALYILTYAYLHGVVVQTADVGIQHYEWTKDDLMQGQGLRYTPDIGMVDDDLNTLLIRELCF